LSAGQTRFHRETWLPGLARAHHTAGHAGDCPLCRQSQPTHMGVAISLHRHLGEEPRSHFASPSRLPSLPLCSTQALTPLHCLPSAHCYYDTQQQWADTVSDTIATVIWPAWQRPNVATGMLTASACCYCGLLLHIERYFFRKWKTHRKIYDINTK
jgi:hypothetical protein